MKYRYTGKGVMTAHIDGKRYELGYRHPRLKDTFELTRKLKEHELAMIGGLELVDESKKKNKSVI